MQRSDGNSPRMSRVGLLVTGALVVLVVLVLALAGRKSRRTAAAKDATAAPAGQSPAARRLVSLKRTKTPPRAQRPSGTQVALRAGWGRGPDQLGRKQADESAPEGPASFVVDRQGRAYVLDQVNLRIQVYQNGKHLRSIPLPADTFEDIAVLEDGSIAVLDRLSRRTVRLMDSQGQLLGEVDLEGPGVAEGGGVTGLFARPDGLWVEVAHGRLVRVMDSSGQADAQRPWVAGRFSADGSQVLSAALDGRHAAQVVTRPPVAAKVSPRRLARVEFDLRLAHLTALESDAAGNVYLGALTARHRPTPPHDLLEQRSVVVVLDPAGQERRRINLPAPVTALEFLRSVRVGPDGTVWHLAFDASGATLRRY